MITEYIALGFGNNIDFEIEWDTATFESLLREHDVSISDLAQSESSELKNLKSLLISILVFMKQGSGGERPVASVEIIKEFASSFRYRITLGGTAARAAVAIHKLGHTAAIHLVTMNNEVRALLPEGFPWVCSAKHENLYPHLIIQFDKGTKVSVCEAEIEAKQANRIIYVHDPENTLMEINPDFAAVTKNAQVLLVAGFNAMTSRSRLQQQIKKVRSMLANLRDDCKVYYEDACYHTSDFQTIVKNEIVRYVDVYGMNEDEFRTYLGNTINLSDPVEVFSALATLSKIVPSPLIVVHTKNWTIGYGENAKRYRKALHQAVVLATTRLRKGDNFSTKDVKETEFWPIDDNNRNFCRILESLGKSTICCQPSFVVSEKGMTTIGLGDAFVGGFLTALLPITEAT